MFGSLGAPELLFILGLALLIFGPSKLPEMGRTLGKAMAEFRKAANDFKRTLNAEAIEREMRDVDPRRAVNDTLAKAKKELDSVMHADTMQPDSSSGSGEAKRTTEDSQSSASEAATGATADPRVASGTVARGSSGEKADAVSGGDRSGGDTSGDDTSGDDTARVGKS